MNKIIILAISALMFSSCGDKGGDSSSKLKSELDSVSYAYGQYMALQIASSEWDKLNPEMIALAFKDFNEKGDSGMVFKEMDLQNILMTYAKTAQTKASAKESAKNGKEGSEFLAKNKANEGIVELPSGLQYKVLVEGTGATPTVTDTVMCNYIGKFINGESFDGSEEGEPRKFLVNQVIPGWTEALQLMKVGSKWMLYIPSNLAYGDEGRQGIPPAATLIFEMELVSILK